QTVMPRYADLTTRWDVVNEPIAEDHGVDGLRASPFLAAFGPDYIRRALETARAAAPHAKLAINDFGFERDTPIDEVRRRRLLRLLGDLIKTGAPLDIVGLESHLDLGVKRLPAERLAAFLREIAARGLAIHVTELDVKEADYPLPAARRDERVARAVKGYLEVVLAQPATRSVTTWGLTDRYSWLEVTPADLARFPNDWKDGSSPGLNRGLPLDSDLRPKPMRQALIEAFAAAARKTTSRPII
ncbi:MAG: endo-1,4-beta-xylanase, partial [Alphaproteobacteria bacterium]|nr:endo-1,4-beta-xylanase [Alphaproteobacteria bacterium]